MNAGLPVLWSPAQQAWLQAMGYTVYHDGELAAELDAALQLSVAEAEAAAVTSPAAAPGREARPAAPAMQVDTAPRRAEPDAMPNPPPPRRPAPVAVPDTEPLANRPRATGNARQPAVRLPDRLQIALLRASGCNPNDPATQALMDNWPLDQLRRDPAAKRALWPQLRALRKQEKA